MTSAIGSPVVNDLPRCPVTTPPIILTYCTGTGSVSPSELRTACFAAAVAPTSPLNIASTTSPGRSRTSAKINTDMPRSVGMRSSRRPVTYRSIDRSGSGARPARAAPASAPIGGGAGTAPPPCDQLTHDWRSPTSLPTNDT